MKNRNIVVVGHYRLSSGRFGRSGSKISRVVALLFAGRSTPCRTLAVGARRTLVQNSSEVEKKNFLLFFSQSVSKFKYLQYICSGEIGFET